MEIALVILVSIFIGYVMGLYEAGGNSTFLDSTRNAVEDWVYFIKEVIRRK